jgi:hypothetical protein
LNLYAYVQNNPLTRVDPDGHLLGTPVPVPGGTEDQQKEASTAAPQIQSQQQAQEQSINHAPQYSVQEVVLAVATVQSIQHIGEVVYQETRPMSDNGKAQVPLTTAREMIADVYLNGNHKMAPGTNSTKSSQEKAALSDSLQASINAGMHRKFGIDITGGATKYNQSPNDHSRTAGGGAFCPNSCPIKGSYGPYVNANPSAPVEHYINIYQ